ncbi:MAG: amidohydrolase family protein [Planctomycetes bacterium]|nr:amidohydrolase family protein [Planctomycetota bacterium]
MSRRSTCLLFAALAGLVAAAPRSQDLLAKAPPQDRPVLLKNAVLHTVTGGVVLGGSLWFEHGRIGQVLPADTAPTLPTGVEPLVLDLAGKHVFPGLVSACTTLGLVEIGAVRQTNDLREVGETSPEATAAVALNPDSTAIPVARSNGVLTAGVFPDGGLLPGRASVIRLDGWTNADMTVRGAAGPVVAWPADSRSRRSRRGPDRGEAERSGDGDGDSATRKARRRIDDAFTAARAWLDARTADPTVALDVRHEALVDALRGEVPVFLLADEQEQIESAVRWATSRQLRAVVVGGRDAEACATLLRERNVPVIVNGVHRLPRRDDSAYDEAFTLPARLAAQGVRFCIGTGSDFSNDRNLPYHAATAAAFGLDRQRALRAITQDAAEILGVGDRLGSLAPGKEATLFVADGHPFDLTTHIELAFVQGRQVDLRNKQTELAEKYRERYRQLRGR